MSGPKLRLVQTPGGDEPPFDEAELRAAEATRAAVERGDEPVSSSLRAAFKSAKLDPADHDALLARALGDLDAEPTAAERRVAERLAERLEEPAAKPPAPAEVEDALELVRALRAAAAPTPIDRLVNEALVERAVRAPGAVVPLTKPMPKRRGVPAAAIAGALALAAAFALFFLQRGGDRQAAEVAAAGAPTAAPAATAVAAAAPAPGGAAAASRSRSDGPTKETTAMVRTRSTASLFDDKFPKKGGESARIDRIASARSADLRDNLFDAWGVR